MPEWLTKIMNENQAIGHVEGHAKGLAEGLAEGRIEGALNTLSDLVRKGLLPVKAAADQAGMLETEFCQKAGLPVSPYSLIKRIGNQPEVKTMSEWLKNVINENQAFGQTKGFEEGFAHGLAEGRAESTLNTLSDLVRKDLLPLKAAADQAGMSKTEFCQKAGLPVPQYSLANEHADDQPEVRRMSELLTKAMNENCAIGEAKGILKGRAEGAFNTLSDLVRKGLLTVKTAADQAGMTETEFCQKAGLPVPQ